MKKQFLNLLFLFGLVNFFNIEAVKKKVAEENIATANKVLSPQTMVNVGGKIETVGEIVSNANKVIEAEAKDESKEQEKKPKLGRMQRVKNYFNNLWQNIKSHPKTSITISTLVGLLAAVTYAWNEKRKEYNKISKDNASLREMAKLGFSYQSDPILNKPLLDKDKRLRLKFKDSNVLDVQNFLNDKLSSIEAQAKSLREQGKTPIWSMWDIREVDTLKQIISEKQAGTFKAPK